MRTSPAAAVALSLAVAWSALAMGGEPTISAREGRAGAVRLGDRAEDARHLLRQKDGTYRTRDGGVVCRVDGSGRIVEISITTPDLVTERLIRAGRSTLTDVVRAYGSPLSSRNDGEEVVLVYPYLRFHFLRHAMETVGEHAYVERVVLRARPKVRAETPPKGG